MRRSAIVLCSLVLSLFLAGCFTSSERQCLDSVVLEFKDPDSAKVIKNLGKRGMSNVNFFWLRYAAKNSYGAFVSQNMACHKVGEKWIRATEVESDLRQRIFLAKLDWATKIMTESSDAYRACIAANGRSCGGLLTKKPWPTSVTSENITTYIESEAKTEADQLLFDSLDDVPAQFQKPS
jgi:hypothetical protein